METSPKDPFFEICGIVRQMESNCERLFRKTVADMKEGLLSHEEGMEILGKIEKERDKNKDVLRRLEEYLKKVKIIEE